MDKGQIKDIDRFGNTHVFQIEKDINNVPECYVVWAIGRENFPYEGYIPLAKRHSSLPNYMDTRNLIALKCPTEGVALSILKRASLTGKVSMDDVRKEFRNRK